MRRIIGLVLIGIGVCLVVLAVALPTFVYPRVAKVPANPQERIVARGTGLTVLLPSLVVKGGNGVLTDQTVISSRLVLGQVPPNGSKVPDGDAFYRQAYNAFIQNPRYSSQDSLLEANIEAASLNGRTGLSTNCCGDYFISDPTDPRGEPIRHRGLVFKFPFNTQRHSYEFWDSNIKATATARFDRTEKLDGLLTYRFVQPITDEVIGQQTVPGSLVNSEAASVTADRVYSTVRTLWIEPRTGAIIKGAENVNQRLVAPNGQQAPVINGRLEYTPQTVRTLVDKYGPQASKLKFITTFGPIGGWILGPILALIGIGLLFLSRRSGDEWDSQWGDYDDEDDEEDEAQSPHQTV